MLRFRKFYEGSICSGLGFSVEGVNMGRFTLLRGQHAPVLFLFGKFPFTRGGQHPPLRQLVSLRPLGGQHAPAYPPNDTVDPHELSDALREEGLNDKYLILEEVRVHSLRNVYQWNLTDPVNDELLFSSRVMLEDEVFLDKKDTYGAVGNSLLSFLQQNSQKVSGKIKEERIFPYFKKGFNIIISVVNPSIDSDSMVGYGLELYREYRFSQPLALRFGANYNLFEYGVGVHSSNKTKIARAPLLLKWYITNGFDIRVGPQLNHISNPQVFNIDRKDLLIDENKFTWDMSFGVGFSFELEGGYLVMDFGYSKAMTELGKARLSDNAPGPAIELDTFYWGIGAKW